MRSKCRLWWPKQLSSTEPSSSTILFGWFISSSSASLDIVVAFTYDYVSLSSTQYGLQGIVHETNGNMPVFLQDKQDMFGEKYGRSSCGCHKLDGLLEQSRLASVESNNWIQLVYGSHEYSGRKIKWIPKLHHIHQDRQIVSFFNLHVILYETPEFGGHHFSSGFWSSSEQLKPPLKKPKWVEELHQKQPLLDLDTIVLAINSASAAKLFFERCVHSERSTNRFPIVCMFFTFTWQLLAERCSGIHWKIVQIRCCQIFYWPIFLQDNGLRSRSCVEYAEKAALHRHSMWSSVVVDVLLGNLLGVALVIHAESACLWVSEFASDITNYWLRTGCVWLMGVPAGFKLNTELAGVLGMISLNAIQIWSTLWFFVGFLFIYFIKVLAISGLLFGLTTPAALILDMILLATLHVSALHWSISLLYSQQIRAIAALWRLFRGRKWNPLRQRFDSYDYTVEQHIVGSLLFTPLLLLLPTTSVFYIFFTIINTTISFICIIIEIMISFIHATPYTKIFLWLVRPRRFPSGIWFEVISCQSNTSDSMEIGCLNDIGSQSEKSQETMDISRSRSSILVSFLHSNFMDIGQIIWPRYRYVFSVVSGSFVASSAYGVLTGKCIQSTLGTDRPSSLPWIFIPYKEYWRLCRDSVLGCKADCNCHVFQQSNNTKSDVI
ncbi:hypothetical protein F0562_033533 [Nyssa sinensis]|uniref:Uncharacterized protein n=1 Tax=Nyssa sinensis TaxID=561372 RepID=A0A5J5AFL3_9ASTE|nr:hypothetical protein F0562_033533 [Nyssa sinensis]